MSRRGHAPLWSRAWPSRTLLRPLFSRLKAGVALDLEWLLNTRQNVHRLPQDSELQASLLSYGLPDTTSMSLHSQRDRQRLKLAIESTIARFEPRLTQVQVLMESVLAQGHILQFRIEAVLRVDPEPQPVTFNTTLEVNNGQYQVK